MHTACLIIGSGPAGYTAAIYASRAALKPILIQGDEPGGQLMLTSDVENYPGFVDIIQGPFLMEQMKLQAQRLETKIISDLVNEVDFSTRPFLVKTESKQTYTADALIISTGAKARWLGIESEKKYMGRGVSGCAICDAFFYKDKVVCVIGGGDAACEEANYLTHFASKVYLIHRRDQLRADQTNQNKVFKNSKIELVWNCTVDEILGDNMKVTGIRLKDTQNSELKNLKLDGVFMAIGHDPATSVFKGQIDIDDQGYIVTKPGTAQTSVPGIFAAGDVQDHVYRQAITAAGQGCMAALEAERYLRGQ